MKRLLVVLIIGTGLVLVVPGVKRSDRVVIANLLAAASLGLIAFSKALSFQRKADAAEAANQHAKRESAKNATPAFEWFIPTGSSDSLDIHVKNAGGMITVTYAGITSGGKEVSLAIPTGKIAAGQMMSFRLTPPVPDKTYPMQFRMQFQDVRENRGEVLARCDRLGTPFVADPA